MRYFADGDLTAGLDISHKPYKIPVIEGEYHVVWYSCDKDVVTTDYDDGDQLQYMKLTVSQVEPSDKRKKVADGLLRIDMNFLKWGLVYEGIYNKDGPATSLTFKKNTTPDIVAADEDGGFLYFGTVLDDQRSPFLQLAIDAVDTSLPLGRLQTWEFIAKKTDPSGVSHLELTKNEKLRLGYAYNEDGKFAEDEEKRKNKKKAQEDLNEMVNGNGNSANDHTDVTKAADLGSESYESLSRRLQEHVRAQEDIIEKMLQIRENMDRQLDNVAMAGQRLISLTPLSGTKRPGSSNNTHHGARNVQKPTQDRSSRNFFVIDDTPAIVADPSILSTTEVVKEAPALTTALPSRISTPHSEDQYSVPLSASQSVHHSPAYDKPKSFSRYEENSATVSTPKSTGKTYCTSCEITVANRNWTSHQETASHILAEVAHNEVAQHASSKQKKKRKRKFSEKSRNSMNNDTSEQGGSSQEEEEDFVGDNDDDGEYVDGRPVSNGKLNVQKKQKTYGRN